jgi:hypothetical protein
MHSSAIKLVVDRVADILRSNDPFLVDHKTVEACNEVLEFLTLRSQRKPIFACSIWHYLLDHGYQIGNCSKHDAFAAQFNETLVTITPEKRAMLRKISDRLFVKSSPLLA